MTTTSPSKVVGATTSTGGILENCPRIEREGSWYLACAREFPGANGQGRTPDEALESLREAVALILEDRREDALRGLPASS
jgi:predicted RNase H-like HicB family nuclease